MSAVDREEVAHIVHSLYGLTGKVSNLGSCQDINFKFTDMGSGTAYVVKFTDSAVCSEQDILFQHAAILYLQSCPSCAKVSLPIPLSTTSGTFVSPCIVKDRSYHVRMLKFVKGNILSEYKYFSPDVLFSFGAVVAGLTLSMAGFEQSLFAQPQRLSVADREIEWDLRRAEIVIDGFLPSFCESIAPEEVSRREAFLVQYERAKRLLTYARTHSADAPPEEGLRTQILHGDLAHYNVVAQTDASGRPFVTGVIDFGDAMRSWTVAELAVAVVSGFATPSVNTTALEEACAVLKGFHSAYPLNACEVTALWPLVILRSLVNILCIRAELLRDPGNSYNLEGIAVEWRIFDRIAAVPMDLALEALRATAGFPSSRRSEAVLQTTGASATSVSLFDASAVSVRVVDLSVESPLFTNGNWRRKDEGGDPVRDIVNAIALPSSTAAVAAFVCPYGVPLMHRSNTNSLTEPDAVALGTRILFRPASQNGQSSTQQVRVQVPVDFVFVSEESVDGAWTAVFEKAEHLRLTLTTMHQGAHLQEHCLCVGADAEVFVQLTLLPAEHGALERTAVPAYCAAHMFPAWRRICPSPHAYFGLPGADASASAASGEDTAQFAEELASEEARCSSAVARRTLHVASVQEHYFRRPPRIERGYREHLYSPTGRGYLDMVNNVAVVGHCHPLVFEAATAQMRLLNTNSRFIYKQLGAFADKIVASMPANAPHLNAVFFVNSGSEATDLAMRLARTVATYHRNQRDSQDAVDATQQAQQQGQALCRDTICLEGAYHGVTTASDEVSTTLNDNPHALSSRPDWIHLAPMPNPFRGKFPYESAPGEPSAGDRYADFVSQIIVSLQARSRIPACFIAEPLSGNAGGVELPPGYLKRVYAEVRAAGGLCIADEVQVGYGRLGTHFWGHQEHDVVPDILTMAKAAGNGHPLGFVVTSKENAAIFGAESGSFFSSAGGGPVSCAIGCAVLDAIAAEGLQQNAKEVGAYLHEKLLELAARNKHIVGCIHGHGLYQGIELVRGEPGILAPSAETVTESPNYAADPGAAVAGKKVKVTPATAEAYAICERLLNLGVICHNTGDYSNVLKVKPPLCFSRQDADFFVHVLEIALQGW